MGYQDIPDEELPRDRVQDVTDTVSVFLSEEKAESVREDIRKEAKEVIVRLRDPEKSSETPPPETIRLGDFVRELLDIAREYDPESTPTEELGRRLGDSIGDAVRTAIRDMVDEVAATDPGAPTPSTETPTSPPRRNDLKDAEAVRDAFGDGDVDLPRKETGRVDYPRLVYLLTARGEE